MNGSQVSSSEDDSESRKQFSSGGDDGSLRDKDKPAQDNVHLKILIPSVAAGAIIGRGGEAIGQLQKDSGAKVKMSKANDFYPGTTERVCLIVGTVSGIERVHGYVMDRIAEKPDTNSKPIEITLADGSKQLVERGKQVKVLVPNSTAGMIIGKGGAYIKELKDRTGSFIQISQKGKEVNLTERCITIAGEVDQNRQTVHLILQKIAEDPQSASCPNISYSDVHGPVASAHPTGSPYACPLSPSSSSHSQQHATNPAHSHPGGAHGGPLLTPGTSAMLTPPTPSTNQGPPQLGQAAAAYQSQTTSNWAMQQAVAEQTGGGPNGGLLTAGITNHTVEQLSNMLRQSGYTDQATDEILNAMCTLANYGFLNLATLNMNVGIMPNAGGRQSGTLPAQLGLPAQLTSLALPLQAGAIGGASNMNVNVPSVSPASAPLSIASPSSSFNLGASGISFMQQSSANNSAEQQNATPTGQEHTGVADRLPDESMYPGSVGTQLSQVGGGNPNGGYLMTQAGGMQSQQFVNPFVGSGAAPVPTSTTFSATANAFNPQATITGAFSPQTAFTHSTHFAAQPNLQTVSAFGAPPNSAANGSQSTGSAQAPQSTQLLDPITMAALTSQSGLLQPDYAALLAASDVGLSALSLSLSGVPATGSPLISPAVLIAPTTQPDRIDLGVPESLIGVILGVAGRQIGEIQANTGTNIQVSKKGVFQPGSKNRLVTISGPPANVQRAALIIRSRIETEEVRRARETGTGSSSAQSARMRQTSGGSGWEKGSGPGTVTPTPSDLIAPNEARDGATSVGAETTDGTDSADK